MNDIIALILAAGKGTRMKSKLPKVLHKVGGVPMVERVLHTAQAAGTTRQIVVVGFGGDLVRDSLRNQAETAVQAEQLGTGHAVLQAEPLLQGISGTLLVTCGDTPNGNARRFAGTAFANAGCGYRSDGSAAGPFRVWPRDSRCRRAGRQNR